MAVTFDLSLLDDRRREAVDLSLARAEFPPDWDTVDTVVKVAHSSYDHAFTWMDPTNPIINMAWNQWSTIESVAETFSHERGHLDDCLFVTTAEQIAEFKALRRYPDSMIWSAYPPRSWYRKGQPKRYLDQPDEWFAQSFGIAYDLEWTAGKKWSRWARLVREIRGG